MTSHEHPTSVPPSVEDGKLQYRRWFEDVVSGGDLALADELLGPGYRLRFPGTPEPLDREAHKTLVMMFRTAFPDWAETVEDVIAEGDEVVIRVTGRGTHEGEFQGIPPTGAQVTATGVGIGRIQDGCIAEAWATYDALGLMPQLGAVPASERPPGMIRVEKEVLVDRPAEEVFDFLADVRNEEQWNPNVIAIESESDGPLPVGGMFEGVYRRGGRMRFELIEAVRPSRLVFRGGGRRMALVATLELERVGSATYVRMRGEMEPRGPLKLLAPVMRKPIERQYEQVSESFRQVVEGDTRR